ncbi:carbohydrate ABC transporter permease, partial [Bifidobacterium longum]|nr:carbohydrate ABC transporter permease [Bifidobacterium longum]MDB6639269.1 carbohydrate ABC transporter permease [Bifidobacterium longum]MDB6641103.1 carbohydrate ABC transporter permease [Bifidobacterium longum]MDB6643063.1 carbohydrate ABC transporter permease [Bifidobacterium longum]MDB6651028.1 carbohydrate ABC transporter permease [Bifidobacterium longum]
MTDKLRHGPLWTTIFAIISLIWIYPIALVFINSFKKRVYISKDVFSLPTGDTFVGLENYERGIEKTDILPSFGWTIILTLGSVALILLCCSMCAWWIVRVNNWVAKLIYLAFIASVVVPFQMVMFPLSKLTDTWRVLVIVATPDLPQGGSGDQKPPKRR